MKDAQKFPTILGHISFKEAQKKLKQYSKEMLKTEDWLIFNLRLNGVKAMVELIDDYLEESKMNTSKRR